MKIGDIAKTNKKGQIVIPKKIREELGISEDVPLHITVRGQGVYMCPIRDVIAGDDVLHDAAYKEVLNRTQGSWADDTWDETQYKQSSIEKKASQKGKREW